MNNKVQALIDSIEPLISIQLKTADRFDLDSITISVARARETLKQLREIQNEFKTLKTSSKTFIETMDKKFAHIL